MTTAIDQIETTLRNLGMLEFSGEVQLLAWSKSTSTDGPKLKVMLQSDDDVAPFELATVAKGKQAGQLYHLFAIRLDAPAQPKPQGWKDLGSLCKSAIELCKSEKFQQFATRVDSHCIGEEGAKNLICEWCGIFSRSELDTDETAKARFNELMARYRADSK